MLISVSGDRPVKLYTWEEIKVEPGIYKSTDSYPSTIMTFTPDRGKHFQLLMTKDSQALLCTEPETAHTGWSAMKFKKATGVTISFTE